MRPIDGQFSNLPKIINIGSKDLELTNEGFSIISQLNKYLPDTYSYKTYISIDSNIPKFRIICDQNKEVVTYKKINGTI